MSIELGLSRITKLLSYLGNPQEKFRVLHVAGTNGKGSVCSLLQSVLQQNALNLVGKFTSPHLIHITDCISVNNKPISTLDFNSIRARLDHMNSAHKIGCTEFELLTCTALEYFHLKKCNWCVLEVGMGGRLDATNCTAGSRKVCGITKIGMDHQGFLGNTLQEIAVEKAGVVTPGVPFVAVDGTNDKSVLDIVEKRANLVGATFSPTTALVSENSIHTDSWGKVARELVSLNGDYQKSNIAVALSILDFLQREDQVSISRNELLDGLKAVTWPGRLQNAELIHLGGQKTSKVLLDGAHNGNAAESLASYIKDHVRRGSEPLRFLIAVTQGKDLEPLLSPLIRSCDEVIVTKFGPVDRMPWISAMDPCDLAGYVSKYTSHVLIQPSIQDAIGYLQSAPPSQTVVCGSLYLCGQLLKSGEVKW
ncbi:LAQU0S01e12090g1_1 [Lachancea quebecensis]|uniref:Dihydrofolate synthetase n=1 Tax=Lachancea quebecensis TaxID=1654605 RepID=A0A0P1KMQ0_9SACH|nr:LAQU0S01e12090g1_1 [Lachancea quebecensis]